MEQSAKTIIRDDCAKVLAAMDTVPDTRLDDLVGDVVEYVEFHGNRGGSLTSVWDWIAAIDTESDDYCGVLFASILRAYAKCGICNDTGVDPDGGSVGPETYAAPCECWRGGMLDDGERSDLGRAATRAAAAADTSTGSGTVPVRLGAVQMRRAW